LDSRGAYCLCLRVLKALWVRVGSLGVLFFPPGRYIYVGSALRGLEGRLERHMELNMGLRSKVFWHIDHLLTDRDVEIEAVYIKPSDRRIECEVAESVSRVGRAVRGFGSSDCRCQSHLFQVDDLRFLSGLGFRPWFEDGRRLKSGESVILSEVE
jgi:Uri superfamily endonuclease